MLLELALQPFKKSEGIRGRARETNDDAVADSPDLLGVWLRGKTPRVQAAAAAVGVIKAKAAMAAARGRARAQARSHLHHKVPERNLAVTNHCLRDTPNSDTKRAPRARRSFRRTTFPALRTHRMVVPCCGGWGQAGSVGENGSHPRAARVPSTRHPRSERSTTTARGAPRIASAAWRARGAPRIASAGLGSAGSRSD